MFLRFCNKSLKKVIQISKRKMSKDSYVWMDLEMTGLNPEVHTILEVSCIITNPNLEYVDEGIDFVIHQSDEVLKKMNDWCLKTLAESGLPEESRQSKISLSEGEKLVADYIKKHTNPEGINYLAGNSVYMDRQFLRKYMPSVEKLFHYRLIDVSSIKILCSHWYPEKYETLKKGKTAHRSLDDIKNSIKELQNYKKAIFL